MNKYYVYIHKRKDTDTVFYVGKGQGKRAYTNRNRNVYWHRIVKKVGYSVEIVETFKNEKDALLKEIDLIKFYRSNNQCEANLNEGGSGLSGRKHSEEALLKISMKSRGENNPMYGLKRPHSKENIEKMRGINHPHSKKVIDTSTLKVYPSLGSAARELGYKAPTLATMLNGWRTNKTSLMYLEKYNGITT